jgi:hypothetical protein
LSFEGQSTAISLQHKSHNKHNAVRNIRCVSGYLYRLAARLISQSTASQELHDAFNQLVSSPSQRGLLATIKNETLVPLETLQANQDFRSDLSGLSQHLSKDEARYANVRQKMLFASTRLTLVRELGVERFRETVFCTTAEELTPAGWDRHEKHNRLDAPLTEEEAGLKHIKDTEALESSGGTGGRSLPSAGIALNLGDEVSNALESLKDSREGSLVMIVSLDTLRLRSSETNYGNRKSTFPPRHYILMLRSRTSNPPTSAPKSARPSLATHSTTTLVRRELSSCTAAPARARSRNAWSTLHHARSSSLWHRTSV